MTQLEETFVGRPKDFDEKHLKWVKSLDFPTKLYLATGKYLICEDWGEYHSLVNGAVMHYKRHGSILPELIF